MADQSPVAGSSRQAESQPQPQPQATPLPDDNSASQTQPPQRARNEDQEAPADDIPSQALTAQEFDELLTSMFDSSSPRVPCLSRWPTLAQQDLIPSMRRFSAQICNLCATTSTEEIRLKGLKQDLHDKWHAISISTPESDEELGGAGIPVLRTLLYQSMLDLKILRRYQAGHDQNVHAISSYSETTLLDDTLRSIIDQQDIYTLIPDVPALREAPQAVLCDSLFRIATWITSQCSDPSETSLKSRYRAVWSPLADVVSGGVFREWPHSMVSILLHQCLWESLSVLECVTGKQRDSTSVTSDQQEDGVASSDQASSAVQPQHQSGAAAADVSQDLPSLSQGMPLLTAPFHPPTGEGNTQRGQPQSSSVASHVSNLDEIAITILQCRLANMSIPTVQDLIDHNVSRDKLFIGFVRALSELVPVCELRNRNKPEILAKWKPLKDERDGLTHGNQGTVGTWSVEELRAKVNEILRDAWNVQSLAKGV